MFNQPYVKRRKAILKPNCFDISRLNSASCKNPRKVSILRAESSEFLVKRLVAISIVIGLLFTGFLLIVSKSSGTEIIFTANVRVDDTGNNFTYQLVPSVAVDNNNGKIYVMYDDWRNDEDGYHTPTPGVDGVYNSDIYICNSSDKGLSFGSSLRVNDDTGKALQENAPDTTPSMVVDKNGVIHAVWTDWRNDVDGYEINPGGGVDGLNNSDIYYANSSDGGVTFSANKKINDDTVNAQQDHPSITVDNNGKIHVVWRDWREAPKTYIYYANSSDGGIIFNSNKRIDDYSGPVGQTSPSIAIDNSNNNIYVVWEDRRNAPSGVDIYFARSTDDGISFENIKRVDNDSSLAGRESPQIAAKNGLIGVVWSHSALEFNINFANSTNNGDTFGDYVKVNDDDGSSDHTQPSVKIDDNGGISVVWADKRRGNRDIYYANSTNGGQSFSQNRRINDDLGSGGQIHASIDIDNRGVIYIAWTDGRKIDSDIYFARSNRPPPMTTPISPPNDSTLSINNPVLEVTSVSDLDNDTVYYNFTISDQPDAESGIFYYSGWIESTTWSTPLLTDGKWYWHTYTSDMWNTTAPNWVWNFTIDTTYPDLEITNDDIFFLPSSLVDNQTLVTINATIRNIGNDDAFNVNVSFFDGDPASGGSQIGTEQTITSILANGGVGWAEINDWFATPIGIHNIYVIVDPDNNTAELNESNNIANRTIEVGDQDYIPWNTPPPQQKVTISGSVLITSQVRNIGNVNATIESTIAFYNQSTPISPFSSYPVPSLNESEISFEYNAVWTAPSIAGLYYVEIKVDYDNDIDELDEGNNAYVIEFNVTNKPITTIDVGTPQFGATPRYVTSSTQFSFSVVDPSSTGYETYYYVDAPPWILYTGPFIVTSEGSHTIYYNSTDNLEGAEDTHEFEIIVDNTPPTTSIRIDGPRYRGSPSANWNVTSATTFNLTAVDGGQIPVVLHVILYNVDDDFTWFGYQQEINLSGLNDGLHTIYYRAMDQLGNLESANSLTVYLDDSVPATSISPESQSAEIDTMFSLTASDAGSGVNYSQYSIDNGSWINYSTSFSIGTAGHHTIRFRSVDNLGNVETEKTLSIDIFTFPPPPPPEPEESNWKPVVAAVFAIILILIGTLVSIKRPLRLKEDLKKNRIYTWMIFILPFVIAEIGTGVISGLTGLLSVPPLLGPGMVVDLVILVTGLIVSLGIYMKMGRK